MINKERITKVQKVDCVTYESGYKEPADPIWRIEINGYCADFPTETAANNFASAIERASASSQAVAPTEEIAPERIRVAQDPDGFWTCRQAVSGSQEYIRDDLYYAANNQVRASEAQATDLRRKLEETRKALSEARNHISRYADTAVEHDLIARIDALTGGVEQ